MRKRGNKQKAGVGGRTAIGASGQRRPACSAQGEAVAPRDVTEQTRAAAAEKSPGGAAAEAPPPRGSLPALPRGRTAAETNTHTKAGPLPARRGPSADIHWTVKEVLYPVREKAAV